MRPHSAPRAVNHLNRRLLRKRLPILQQLGLQHGRRQQGGRQDLQGLQGRLSKRLEGLRQLRFKRREDHIDAGQLRSVAYKI